MNNFDFDNLSDDDLAQVQGALSVLESHHLADPDLLFAVRWENMNRISRRNAKEQTVAMQFARIGICPTCGWAHGDCGSKNNA